MTKLMTDWANDSFLAGANANYLEAKYELYCQSPASVSPALQEIFAHWGDSKDEVSHTEIRDRLRAQLKQPISQVVTRSIDMPSQQAPVDALIEAYRCYGHRQANLDPLGLKSPSDDERLHLSSYGLQPTDLSTVFQTRGLLKQQTASLSDIVTALKQTYSAYIGFEYQHILDAAEKKWLCEKIEAHSQGINLPEETRHKLLHELTTSEVFEHYLDKRYVGQKRFSIEGLESLVPMLNLMLQEAAAQKIESVVLGMAHRGRLNVMYNVMGMSAGELFKEFEGKADYGYTSGDVKYHLGVSSQLKTTAGDLHATLVFNPSHLEFISPVIAGSVRARQWRDKPNHSAAMGITIHGDASFSGQGVVMESMNMARLRGYEVGGMIRIIANNQIGFTASDKRDLYSSVYNSDLAKMLDIPVFHVNADHIESVALVSKLAMAYRQTFKKDVVINLIGYRRHGHQEVDEPVATQPVMYHAIKNHPTTLQIYQQDMIKRGLLDEERAQAMVSSIREILDEGGRTVELASLDHLQTYEERWLPYLDKPYTSVADTAISATDCTRIAQAITALPEQFKLVKPVQKLWDSRRAMAAGEQAIDWGFAELMAYASLLDSGCPVRFSGEDCRRGTFYHRHGFVFDRETGEAYSPLLHVSDKQASLQLYDSILSEAAVMGFEYGYSLTDPKNLVIWEAQYGDFANGAQVIIDQFISSAWQKWRRLSGLVLLLPHGYEGAGPEHTSARLERYLQLCAEKNMQVCVPSTPAQMFHLLRRQICRDCRLPLIVMTPKSLLRHKDAGSDLSQLQQGTFKLLIDDPFITDKASVTRVILCSGKIYYDLLAARRKTDDLSIALVRIEQLYPFPYDELKALLEHYGHVTDIVWCQEEPKNQGAWYITQDRLTHCLASGQQLSLVSRPPSASPAAGYRALFLRKQAQVVQDALRLSNQNDEV